MSVPAQRDPRGRLLPGFSGNREHTPAFVTALVGLLQSPNETTRLAAFREFMDRLVGRPVQITDSNVKTLDVGANIQALYLRAVKAANAPIDVTPTPQADEPEADNAKDHADDAW
jgi:hypothetical protein